MSLIKPIIEIIKSNQLTISLDDVIVARIAEQLWICMRLLAFFTSYQKNVICVIGIQDVPAAMRIQLGIMFNKWVNKE